MLADIFTGLVGITLFLFLFWRRLKEDYPTPEIFTSAFYVLFGVLLGYLISRFYFPGLWFWLEGVGIALGLTLGVVRYKFRFFEVLENLVLGILPWLGLIFLKDSIKLSSLTSFLAFFAVACLLTLFAYLDASYKNFSWYKSGRVGFSGLTTLGVLFLLRAAFASFFPNVLSFVKYEAILSGITAFVIFLAIFNLARST